MHNADIISGPHDLAACMNLNEHGGHIALTSPRLLKTKSRNFLIHIKTIHDVSRTAASNASSGSGNNARATVSLPPNRRKGILRYLFPSVVKPPTSAEAITALMGQPLSTLSSSSLAANGVFPPVYTKIDQATSTGSNSTSSGIGNATASSSSARNRALAAAGVAAQLGWDWLSEVHVTVRAVKPAPPMLKLPNERHQRIAMVESTQFLHELLRLASIPANAQQKNLALDILLWVMIVRMGRFRSPKMQKTPTTATTTSTDAQDSTATRSTTTGLDCATEMAYQQRNCVQALQQHLVELLRNCILYGNRTTASKCVKVVLVATE